MRNPETTGQNIARNCASVFLTYIPIRPKHLDTVFTVYSMFRVGPTLPYWLRTAIYVHTYISILYCVFYLLFRGGGQKRALWGNKTSFQPKSGSEAPRAAGRPEPTGIFPCAYQGEELPEVSAQFDSVKWSPRWHDGDASPPPRRAISAVRGA